MDTKQGMQISRKVSSYLFKCVHKISEVIGVAAYLKARGS